MEQDKVVEGNVLIAEFMGVKFHKTVFQWELTAGNFYKELEYHSSWDNWLMPVVEKIESLGYDTGICGIEIKGEKLSEVMFSPVNKNGNIEIHSRQPQPKISLTWEAVTQFITWYNQNK